jgi:hypothetical protein
MDPVWDGVVSSAVLNESEVRIRDSLAEASKSYDWNRVFSVLRDDETLVNTTRPGGSSLFAPLHQAAHGGATAEVVARLIRIGAWRTLQNARGERALDVAQRQGHSHLLHALSPEMKRRVPLGVLLKIQQHFHAVIRERADELKTEHGLRLPELEPLLEFDRIQIWFPIPGMYGGFAYKLETEGVEAKIVTKSWSRVIEGSGQRHEITSAGSRLVDEGLV